MFDVCCFIILILLFETQINGRLTKTVLYEVIHWHFGYIIYLMKNTFFFKKSSWDGSSDMYRCNHFKYKEILSIALIKNKVL